MKKIALALGVIAGSSTAAQAQSSATLYGLLDAGVIYTNNANGHGQVQLGSGTMQGSRWGLKGVEDLGGGATVLFVIENGFSVATGRLQQGGTEFGRQAYLGASMPKWGTLTLGRQYDPIQDFVAPFEGAIQWGPVYSAHPGDLDNLDGSNRVNNAVKYRSASYGGVTIGGMYSLGGIAGQFNRNQIWSVGGGYSSGPFAFGVAYLNARNPNVSFFGNMATSSATGSNMTGSRVYSGYASAKTQQIFAAGVSYTIGDALISAVYSNTQFKDIGSEPGLPANVRGDAKFHNAELNARYRITPSFQIGAGFDYTQGYGVNDAKYLQGTLGADYFLSKRTDLYFATVYQHASGTDSTGAKAVANINLVSASSTANQIVAVAGIRHKF